MFDEVCLRQSQQRFRLRVEVAGGACGLQQHVYVVAVQRDRRVYRDCGSRSMSLSSV
jgi:hypothetical protein